MKWLSQNWLWVLILGVLLALHMFAHGAHGADMVFVRAY